jgi:hypothetical protein
VLPVGCDLTLAVLFAQSTNNRFAGWREMEISAEEEDRQLAADQANIAFVQNALHKSNDLTDKMVCFFFVFFCNLSRQQCVLNI